MVDFRKQLAITNPRLQFLYICACLVLAGVLTWKFFYRQEFLEYYNVEHYIHVSGWSGIDARQTSTVQASAESICRGDTDCLPICGWPDAVPGEPCVEVSSLTTATASDDLFYTTRIHKRNPHTGEESDHILPYEQMLNYSFSYSIAIPKREQTTFPESLWQVQQGWAEPWRSRNDNDILTVIVAADGTVVSATSSPGEAVQVGLQDLFELAGLGRDFLSTPQPVVGGADGRHTGVKLILHIECYDERSHWQFSEAVFSQLNEVQWSKARCEVRVIASSERTGWKDVENANSEIVEHHYGVHVVTRTGGSLGRVNYENIYNALVTAYVLSKIPKLFTLFVTTWCLGHLSAIYKRVIYEPFDIAEQVAGTATRFMANTVSFEELCEVGEQDISKHTMHRRIGEAMMRQTHVLDEDEVGTFVNFCHKAIVDLQHFGKHDTMLHEMKKVSSITKVPFGKSMTSLSSMRKHAKAKQGIEQDKTEVDITSFSVACSSIDQVRLLDVMTLFDTDRKTSLLERIFMPRYIRNLVVRAQSDLTRADSVATASWPMRDVSMSDAPERLGSQSTITASASPKFGKADFSRGSDERTEKHATVGSKAYAKVLDLEARTEQLAATASCLQEMEKSLNKLVTADEMLLKSVSSKEDLGVTMSHNFDGVENFLFPEKEVRKRVGKHAKLIKQEVDIATAKAIAIARTEMMKSLQAFIEETVRSSRQQLVTEIITNLKGILDERDNQHEARDRLRTFDSGLTVETDGWQSPRPLPQDLDEDRSVAGEKSVPNLGAERGDTAVAAAPFVGEAAASPGGYWQGWMRTLGATSAEDGARTPPEVPIGAASPARPVPLRQPPMRPIGIAPTSGSSVADALSATDASSTTSHCRAHRADTHEPQTGRTRLSTTDSMFTLAGNGGRGEDQDRTRPMEAPDSGRQAKLPGSALGLSAEPRLGGKSFADGYTGNYRRKPTLTASRALGADLGPSIQRITGDRQVP